MKIQYIRGNLLDAVEPVIIHGCNARGVMGSGVALAIRNKWPKAYQEYRDEFKANGLELGSIVWATVAPGKTIANAITQEFYGPGDKQYVSYEAIEQCLFTLDRSFQHVAADSAAMPLLGAGTGGGDWKIISEMIERTSKNYQPVVYRID